ncbi:MAG: hypothetical protein K2O15_12205 [Lachnospiraceae bacterium]|nr:hypothetical protein [Lachnospiraceae bacterium]
MNRTQFGRFKRIYEYYQAEPSFRAALMGNPGKAAQEHGLSAKDGYEIRDAVLAILKGTPPEQEGNPYWQEFSRRNKAVIAFTSRTMSEMAYKNRQAAAFVSRTLRRCRMESADIRMHGQIHFVPIAFELSEGCRVHCPFCGLNAGIWENNFVYENGGGEFWREILSAAYGFFGDILGQAPLYFATEPLDNPDYECFLEEVHRLTGQIPQTTTAVPERDVSRTKRLISYLGDERLSGEARLRFSVIKLPQFRQIMEAFSPEELAGVELIFNHPESLNCFSDSGRAHGLSSVSRRRTRYSVSCLAGVRVNLCSRKITFMEPVLPDADFPDGCRHRETMSFADGAEFEICLEKLFAKYALPTVPQGRILVLNKEIRVCRGKDRIILAGDGVGFSMAGNLYTDELTALLSEHLSINEIVSRLSHHTGQSEELNRLIESLYQGGYIEVL